MICRRRWGFGVDAVVCHHPEGSLKVGVYVVVFPGFFVGLPVFSLRSPSQFLSLLPPDLDDYGHIIASSIPSSHAPSTTTTFLFTPNIFYDKMSSSTEMLQINGFWVDIKIIESTIVTLSAYSLLFVKLVPCAKATRLALFFTSLQETDELALLKAVRDLLASSPSFPQAIASTISFAKQLSEMPFDSNDEIDASALCAIATERWEKRRSNRRARLTIDPRESTLLSKVNPDMLSPIPSAHPVPTIVVHSPEITPAAAGWASSTESDFSDYSEPSSPVTPAFSAAYDTTLFTEIEISTPSVSTPSFNEVDLETGVSKKTVEEKQAVYKVCPSSNIIVYQPY